MSRTAERQVSFADWELVRQGLRLEPLLQAISDFLDTQKDMIEQVRCDLTRGLKKAETGRSGLTPPQILRSLVLMRIKNWNYRELRERIADGCTLRQFTDFYCLPVPRHDAFHRGFNRLTPETLKAINDLVVQAAVGLGLEDGQKLRVDTTVDAAKIYDAGLNQIKDVIVPSVATNRTHVYHLYTIQHPHRDALAAHLSVNGVQIAINYPTALPFLEAYSRLKHRPEQFPNAFGQQGRILSLPMFSEITMRQQHEVIALIREFRSH